MLARDLAQLCLMEFLSHKESSGWTSTKQHITFKALNLIPTSSWRNYILKSGIIMNFFTRKSYIWFHMYICSKSYMFSYVYICLLLLSLTLFFVPLHTFSVNSEIYGEFKGIVSLCLCQLFCMSASVSWTFHRNWEIWLVQIWQGSCDKYNHKLSQTIADGLISCRYHFLRKIDK